MTLADDNEDDVLRHEDEEDSYEETDDVPAAWQDDDDDPSMAVNIVDSAPRLKKLRRTRDEVGAKALDSAEFERRLRRKFVSYSAGATHADWAKLGGGPAKAQTKDDDDDDDSDDDSDEDGTDLDFGLNKNSTAPMFASSVQRLPPDILSTMRCPDANLSDPNKAVVQSVQFLPNSDPDHPLMLTAGLDKTLRFFQVGAEKSIKVHGIHFPKMPIYSASFLGDSGNVVISGRRSFFYMYDSVAGKVELVPRIEGRSEKSWEKHVTSPDGRTIAFIGNDGNVVLVDAHSRHWTANLKLNGSVRAVSFSADNSQLCASGSDGDIYRWDLRSHRCLERFSNQDGTITSSIDMTSRYMAVGAESGIVNLYANEQQKPLKSINNLFTSADILRFNHDGQMLAMGTRHSKHGLKLLHVPSRTVFSNWPTSKTPLNNVWSMDFSPESKFLAIGNDKGKCLLYRLSHYQ